jgi:hypothetical protein
MSAAFAKEFWRRDTSPIRCNGNDLQAWFVVRTSQIAAIVRIMLPEMTRNMSDREVRDLWLEKMRRNGRADNDGAFWFRS